MHFLKNVLMSVSSFSGIPESEFHLTLFWISIICMSFIRYRWQTAGRDFQNAWRGALLYESSCGNTVDGLPQAQSTAAVLVGLRLGPRRSGNLGVKFVLLDMSVFRFVVLVYSKFQLICKLWSSKVSAQVVSRMLLKNWWEFFKCLVKNKIFLKLQEFWLITLGLLYESLRRELGWRFTAGSQYRSRMNLAGIGLALNSKIC